MSNLNRPQFARPFAIGVNRFSFLFFNVLRAIKWPTLSTRTTPRTAQIISPTLIIPHIIQVFVASPVGTILIKLEIPALIISQVAVPCVIPCSSLLIPCSSITTVNIFSNELAPAKRVSHQTRTLQVWFALLKGRVIFAFYSSRFQIQDTFLSKRTRFKFHNSLRTALRIVTAISCYTAA